MAIAAGVAFTVADLRAAAGRRSFERGLDYVDAIISLEAIGEQWVATVRGSEDYLVILSVTDDGGPGGALLRAECDCPHGQEGFFCKHCVAVGLAIVRGAVSVPAPRAHGAGSGPGGLAAQDAARGPAGPRAGPGLEPWLTSLPRDTLLGLLFDHLLEDDEWRRRLELRAAGAACDLPAICALVAGLLDDIASIGEYGVSQPGDTQHGSSQHGASQHGASQPGASQHGASQHGVSQPGVSQPGASQQRAGRPGQAAQYGYLEGHETWRYARRIREVTEVVTGLTGAGHPREAAEVAELALTAVADASRDASDRAGVIAAAADDLAASHLAACRAAPPDPAELAGFLAVQLTHGGDAPVLALDGYLDLLGQAGLGELRELVSEEWSANPHGRAERRALEEVLTAAGDVTALAELICADSDQHGFAHLRAAQALERAGRTDDALGCAERGLREAAAPHASLADYVEERYHRAGRLADALQLRRERFAASRGLDDYVSLREAAERAGGWAPTRDWALGLLRADAAAGRTTWAASRGPVLIDALIADGDAAAAWAAATGAASDVQWLSLADLAAESRPADALAVYLRLIEPLRRQTGGPAYERMARLLESAKACHARLGTEASFRLYLRRLRDEQRRKSRLLRILDAHGL